MATRHDTLAAVDLGSNSFHLQIGRVVDHQLYLLDSLRDPVRLGAGLTRDRRIDRATQVRAIEALGRFGERLRGFPKGAVRAVGTNALRVARNADAFLADAEAALGFPIEVIFGREEARLIYVGVAHSLPPSEESRLVIDIGGGSTECSIGRGFKPDLTESLSMGCVSWTLRFFSDGRLDKSAFKKAELAAANEVQRILKGYRRHGWVEAIASSGSARSIASVLRESGWIDHGIDRVGLERLRAQLFKAGEMDRLRLPGLKEDRVAVFAGGVAIMSALFGEFGLEHVEVSDSALRQGVLYDLIGRERHEDMREATVSQFMRRYQADGSQAARVGRLALMLFDDLSPDAPDADVLALRFAAALHEIGIGIAHAGYHKHSAYVISQADMPGFSQREQARLAHLVLAHRGKLSKMEGLPTRPEDWPLIAALRLAALFFLARTDVELPRLTLRAVDAGFQVSLPRAWLDEHPLTEAALEAESEEWRQLGMRLELRAASDERIRPTAEAKA
jgi:exopolyphosphatase/guanosine-5'-triphosphate,3'-diphosphate pyrophosphatase